MAARDIGRGDTVAVMAPNVPEIFEAHFGVPMAGAVLNCLNTRLDAAMLAFILESGRRYYVYDAEQRFRASYATRKEAVAAGGRL